MKGRLITCVSCQSGDELWCMDEQIYALCRINRKNLQAECVVPPEKILEDADYEVRKIFVWEDKILILPVRLNQRWVVYHKSTGILEYEYFCEENHRSGASVLFGDRLILLPACAKDPVVILDLRKREIIDRHYFQDVGLIPDEGMEIWEICVDQGSLFFLIRSTCYYGRIKDQKISVIKIHTPEPLCCMDFYKNSGWAVGGNGKYLYQFDENGNLLKSFVLDLKTEIGRILVKEKFIFLLPLEGNRICIFDKRNGKVKKIITEEENIPAFLLSIERLDYWDYVEKEQEVWFLPMRYPLLIINTDTGRSYQKIVTYEEDFLREDYWSYYYEVRKIRKRNSFFDEKSKETLTEYLKLIQEEIRVSRKNGESFGKIIWKALMEENHG